MSPEEVVRAELVAWSHLDVNEIMSYFALDAVWDNVPIAAVTGLDEIRASIEEWVGSMTFFEAEMLNLAVAGNVVLTERVDHVIHEGKTLHARIMGAFEIEGDRIKAWRDYFQVGGGHD